jgi:hypothetical protein
MAPKFIHDRVQQAAYSLMPEASRAEAHLRIGRLLAACTPPQEREEKIFDIVNHLNRGTASIISREERENLAELNLIAGKRAKGSTAYASALRSPPRLRRAWATIAGSGDAVFKDAVGDFADNVGRVFSTVGSAGQIQLDARFTF